ncbi:hypothetical protein [Sinomonas halotolerans]|uniref:ABM domain-containing protein n=1 Tax=Sinomonas halotolerans TaxID=1644133 RepID=A0ABU9WY76_9MICC
MEAQVLTEVSAEVPADRQALVLAGYRAMAAGPFPEGLLRSELLRGSDGLWRVQTLWRDRAALEAMRAAPEPPAALRLFRSVGVEPALRIWEVADALAPGP